MVPIASVLRLRKEKVDRTKTAFTALQPISIHFDGSVSRRDVASGRTYSMELWYARPGDFVVAKIDLKNGAVGIVPRGWQNVAVTGHFAVYEPDLARLVPEYLHLLIQTSFFKELLWRNKVGAEGRKEVKLDFFESLPIPLPPLTTQRAIVAAWHDARDAAAATRARADALETKARAAFLAGLGLQAPAAATARKAFSLDFARVERWGVAQVRESLAAPDLTKGKYPVAHLRDVIADLENGWSPKCHPRPARADEWGVLKLGAVSFGTYDETENKALPSNLKPVPSLEVKVGDVLISRANVPRYVGACAFVEATRPQLLLCDKIFRVVPKASDELDLRYLAEAMKSPHLRRQIENSTTGASPTMQNISKPSLLALRLPLPPLTVQRKLVDAMQAARNEAASLRAEAADRETAATTELEAALLGTSPQV